MGSRVLTVMFTDIKGFTERTSARSRTDLRNMLDTHEALLRPIFGRCGGRVVKTIGDAFMVAFESPTNAVICGLLIQDTLQRHNENVPTDDRLHVRVAINTGECQVTANDLFGEAVNIAARIEAITEADEIYFTESVYLNMQKSEVPTAEIGYRTLKGVPFEVKVYKVLRDTKDPRLNELLDRARTGRLTESAPDFAAPEKSAARSGIRGAWILAGLMALVAASVGVVAFITTPDAQAKRRAELDALVATARADAAQHGNRLAALEKLHGAMAQHGHDAVIVAAMSDIARKESDALASAGNGTTALAFVNEWIGRQPALQAVLEPTRRQLIEWHKTESQRLIDANDPAAAVKLLAEAGRISASISLELHEAHLAAKAVVRENQVRDALASARQFTDAGEFATAVQTLENALATGDDGRLVNLLFDVTTMRAKKQLAAGEFETALAAVRALGNRFPALAVTAEMTARKFETEIVLLKHQQSVRESIATNAFDAALATADRFLQSPDWRDSAEARETLESALSATVENFIARGQFDEAVKLLDEMGDRYSWLRGRRERIKAVRVAQADFLLQRSEIDGQTAWGKLAFDLYRDDPAILRRCALVFVTGRRRDPRLALAAFNQMSMLPGGEEMLQDEAVIEQILAQVPVMTLSGRNYDALEKLLPKLPRERTLATLLDAVQMPAARGRHGAFRVLQQLSDVPPDVAFTYHFYSLVTHDPTAHTERRAAADYFRQLREQGTLDALKANLAPGLPFDAFPSLRDQQTRDLVVQTLRACFFDEARDTLMRLAQTNDPTLDLLTNSAVRVACAHALMGIPEYGEIDWFEHHRLNSLGYIRPYHFEWLRTAFEFFGAQAGTPNAERAAAALDAAAAHLDDARREATANRFDVSESHALLSQWIDDANARLRASNSPNGDE